MKSCLTKCMASMVIMIKSNKENCSIKMRMKMRMNMMTETNYKISNDLRLMINYNFY